MGVDGEEHKYHIQSCDACHDYSKMIATFEPTPVPLLLLEDLLSAHLDQIAMQRGYRHGQQPAREGVQLSA
jgi:formate dehydrogenase maturation protein FdhE